MEFRIADKFTDSLARLTTEEQKAIRQLLKEAAAMVEESKFSLQFLMTEWEQRLARRDLRLANVQFKETVADVVRLGRKTRLRESQRAILIGSPAD